MKVRSAEDLSIHLFLRARMQRHSLRRTNSGTERDQKHLYVYYHLKTSIKSEVNLRTHHIKTGVWSEDAARTSERRGAAAGGLHPAYRS